jgi:SH3-like domain-containing protein
MVRAESATTRERTRLRQGPSAATELVGEVPAGTALDVIGESGGWRQVRAPDGKTGFVWAEHLALGEKPPEAPRRAAEPASAPARSLADDVRDLREQVSALTARPEPASAADLERVREELERLSAAERDLARRLDEHFVVAPPAVDPAPEGTLWTTAGFLAIAVAIVLAASWSLQRRRERRQRSRLRL